MTEERIKSLHYDLLARMKALRSSSFSGGVNTQSLIRLLGRAARQLELDYPKLFPESMLIPSRDPNGEMADTTSYIVRIRALEATVDQLVDHVNHTGRFAP